MTTAIVSPRRRLRVAIGSAISAAFRGIAYRLHALRKHRAARVQLENLTDRLRQDIGLVDSSPSAAELLKHFHRAQQTPPREHASRFKIWI